MTYSDSGMKMTVSFKRTFSEISLKMNKVHTDFHQICQFVCALL
jgi:hypothetical protein